MRRGIPKISVYMITYNQEKVIERTLKSILNQIDYIYEICISDDCSTDKTWEILKEYDKSNPGLFKIRRNSRNIGIFENTEKVWEMPSGDIVYDLAGDDECGEGWFKNVIDFIKEKKIDYKRELFCIYGDYHMKYPNGDSFIFRNNLSVKERRLVYNTLIGVVSSRSCCYSLNVLKLFQNVSKGRSHIVETAQDIQIPFYTKKVYYISKIGNIYNAGEGISVHLSKKQIVEREKIVPYALHFLKRNGYKLGIKEKLYCKYNKYVKRYSNGGGFFYIIIVLFLFLCIYSYPFNVLCKSIKIKIFAIRRLFSHNQSVFMEA